MVRFQNQKKSRKNRRVFLSICVFLVILLLFISGIDSFSDSTRRHQKESLERALNRSIVYCYATEGTYPESLEDLKAHYGLTYDEIFPSLICCLNLYADANIQKDNK